MNAPIASLSRRAAAGATFGRVAAASALLASALLLAACDRGTSPTVATATPLGAASAPLTPGMPGTTTTVVTTTTTTAPVAAPDDGVPPPAAARAEPRATPAHPPARARPHPAPRPVASAGTAPAPVAEAPRPAAPVGELGSITAIEAVKSDPVPTNGAGAVIGGLLGGVLGNQVGGGDGRKAATVIGAVGGAVAGNNVQRNRNREVVGYRLHITLDNGQAHELIVPDATRWHSGDRVRWLADGSLRPA